MMSVGPNPVASELDRTPGSQLPLILSAVPLAALGALLVAVGLWYLAAALLVVVPAFVLLHRYPFAAVLIWLGISPLVSVTDSEALRRVYWLVHRTMPVGVLAIVVVSSMLKLSNRRLTRLEWPELLMAGYLAATVASIAYTSGTPVPFAILLYDRVFIPMCLYLLVRLLGPSGRDLRRLLPVLAFILLSQALIGLVSWLTPGVLPSAWLGKAGARTTGTLRNADLFGTTVLFCGVMLLHAGLTFVRRPMSRIWFASLFLASLAAAFLTFSRATWLAGTVMVVGLLLLYPRFLVRLLMILAVILVLLASAGMLSEQVRFAGQRLQSEQSEESALSRVPVMFAAMRMFATRPVAGWGYENFDRFDREFQGRVGDLFYPEKDHASHNLYLTLLAEQGLIGFALFLGPAWIWLARSLSARPWVPPDGWVSLKLLWILWLTLATHVVINNFVRMQVEFGFGLWWLGLGLIASIVDRPWPGRARVAVSGAEPRLFAFERAVSRPFRVVRA